MLDNLLYMSQSVLRHLFRNVATLRLFFVSSLKFLCTKMEPSQLAQYIERKHQLMYLVAVVHIVNIMI